MIKMNKKELFIILVFSIFVLFISNFNKELKKDNIDSKVCEFSDEYKRWLELTDEERANLIMPPICKDSANVVDTKEASYLDQTYSLLNDNSLTSVKNQYGTSACWTFSITSSLESYMKKNYKEIYDFSERHLNYQTSYLFLNNQINDKGFNRDIKDGGNILIAASYYLNNYGPILENDMPYEDDEILIDLNYLPNKKPVVNVNDINIMQSKGCANISNSIKKHLINYGALATSIYLDTSDKYYNSETNSLFYNGNDFSNHAATIVGWDDNYSVDNFSSTNKPKTNGAWLVRNSFGPSWGNNGYFYVSYEDNIICNTTGGITSVSKDFPDNFYNYDYLGYNAQAGSKNNNTGYAAATYHKEKRLESLKEITVGSSKHTEYEIYIIANKTDKISINNAKKITSGTIEYGGYKTVKISNDIILEDTEFTIIVKYKTLDNYAIPISIKDNSLYKNLEVYPNQSFISEDGINFEDLATYTSNPAVATIKVGTNNV